MGQYYIALILAEKSGKKEYIRLAVSPFSFANGSKLTEHSYIGNDFVQAIEYLLSPNGMFYKSRLVWAGDYADEELDSDKNLYSMVNQETMQEIMRLPFLPDFYTSTIDTYTYIVNHTKQLYMKKPEKNTSVLTIHPLPLLTAEGNSRGGGDYRGSNTELVGTWARDVISLELEVPSDYVELPYTFSTDH
jgi:hypothetical protein